MDPIVKEALLLELERYRTAHQVLQGILPKVIDLPRTADGVISLLTAIEDNILDIIQELGVN
jgi:hypothetical protein